MVLTHFRGEEIEDGGQGLVGLVGGDLGRNRPYGGITFLIKWVMGIGQARLGNCLQCLGPDQPLRIHGVLLYLVMSGTVAVIGSRVMVCQRGLVLPGLT